VALLNRKSEEEKRLESEAKARHKAEREAAAVAAAAEEADRVASLPKWEYQVKRIGGDKQKGLLGSQRMEQIFNAEGARGWELVAIHEERATFKRPRT
jgi:hypothetical protein